MGSRVGARVCAYRYCTVSLEGRRPDCRFCCAAHRAAEARLKARDHVESVRTASAASQGLSRGFSRGRATRLYVTEVDLALLRSALRRTRLAQSDPLRPNHQNLQAKVERAIARLDGRKEK